MSFPDPTWKFRDALDFGGRWSLPDVQDIALEQGAIDARNVEFVNGQVSTRHGFGEALTGIAGGVPVGITGMHNWLFGNSNYLVYWVDGANTARVVDIINYPYTSTAIMTGTGYAGTAVSAGERLIATSFESTQTNTTNPGVIAGIDSRYFAGTKYSDTLFGPPVTGTGTWTEPASGVITPGTHRTGYLIEYRNGQFSRPCPDSGAFNPTAPTFTPQSFVASGGKNARFALSTPFWSLSIAAVWIIMTPANSEVDFRIVPGSRTVVQPNTSYNIDINISDEDLIATGADITKYISRWTQGASSGHPFYPTAAVALGDRMGYVAKLSNADAGTYSALIVSDRNDPQAIYAATSIITLPGQLDITTVFSIGNDHFIVGPHWTYRTSDNGQDPLQWPTPKSVNNGRGTQAIRGVDVARTGDYAWVADADGLYLLTSEGYSDLPVSYLQTPDWKRINWEQAAKIIVKDHSAEKKVYVLAPIEGATSPNAIFTWDYTNGKTVTGVKFSGPDTIQNYELGSIAVFRNDLSDQATGNQHQLEMWVSSTEAKPILRKMTSADANPYRDFTWTAFGQLKIASTSLAGQPVIQMETDAGLDQIVAGMSVRLCVPGLFPGPADETIVVQSVDVGAKTITATTNLQHNHSGTFDWASLVGAPIPGVYATALFPGKESQNGILHWHGFHSRIKGAGNMAPVLKSMDGSTSITLASKALSTSPNQELRWLADMRNEFAYVTFQNSGLDSYFVLSSLRMYYSNWITTR